MPDDSWKRISVCVITLNEEANLPRCLESVLPCGELIVVDSGSADRTRGIADEFGAKWFERKWEGFARQRQVAESQATREFVLFLDADEWLSAELRGEISALLNSSSASERMFAFRRRSEFLDRPIRFGDWINDWVTRLAPRGRARWEGVEPHPFLQSALRVHRCDSPLYHRPYRDEATFHTKLEQYARTWASEAHKEGKRGSRLVGSIRGAWRFVRSYLFRGGFRDGYPGYLIARGNGSMVRRKYAYLAEMRAHARHERSSASAS